MEVQSMAVPTIILQPRDTITPENVDQAQESLSHVCAAITDLLAAQGIAYNLLIADRGMTFYLLPRRKDSEIPDSPFNLGVFDLAGAFYVLQKEQFAKISYKDFVTYCQEHVALTPPDFAALKASIIHKLDSEYQGSTNP